MATGTVKWFNDAKGYGFITPDEGGKDVFAHHTAIASEGWRSLADNQRVELDVTKGPKGMQAVHVQPVSEHTAGERDKGATQYVLTLDVKREEALDEIAHLRGANNALRAERYVLRQRVLRAASGGPVCRKCGEDAALLPAPAQPWNASGDGSIETAGGIPPSAPQEK